MCSSVVHAKIVATSKNIAHCFSFFFFSSTCRKATFVKNQFFFMDQIISDSSGPLAFIPAAHLPPNALSPEGFRFLNFFFIFLINQWKTFIFLFLKNPGIWLDGYISPLENWRFVGESLFLARVCAWLLLARLRAIARIIARTFLLNIEGKYLLEVGFCSCVFCFVFYLVRTKLVWSIFSAFFTAKKCTCCYCRMPRLLACFAHLFCLV